MVSDFTYRGDALGEKLRAALDPGEKVLWSGFPRQGILLGPQDIFLIPFSLLWGGFAMFWEYGAIRDGAPFFFVLWGVPFVLVGLYIIAGRFVADATTRARTIYAVTDQRVVILGGLFQSNLRSLMLSGLSEISTREKSDGTGTISFGPADMFAGMRGWPVMNRSPPAFEGIAGMRDVLRIIREAQRASRRDS